MTLFSGINLALQSMLAHQQAIQVTEHNVANANTPGYHRQEAVLNAGPPYPYPGMSYGIYAGQMGGGVLVNQLRRFSTGLLDAQIRREQASASYSDRFSTLLNQVEGTLAETTEDGVAAKLDAFWSGWQSLSTDPSSLTARADLHTRATALADALNRRASDLNNLRKNQDTTITDLVSDINTSANRIAQLNTEITRVLGIGDQPNDLLDERDRLLDHLSELTGATSAQQENGEVLVSLGGHALVVGKETFALSTTPDAANSNLLQITWPNGATYTPSKGELGAVLTARNQTIPAQLNGLDTLASTLAARVNTLHQSGFGLNNATGLDFFTGTDALSLRVNATLDDVSNIATSAAPDSPGDGSIAGQIAAVQHELLLNGGTTTLNQYQANQAASFGLQLSQALSDTDTRQLVVNALSQQRESESGISLDEEATNLIKYQRAFEAAARLMTTMDEMLNTIINGMGVVGR
ncbi:MAG: flagellar hook-associated protein FlgK [Anaerolineales bacterium]|nr:flagellar hook-associated protein FlgK [Anaerolineales bacterium]